MACPPAEIHLSLPQGEASIILDNWSRIALGRYKKLWEEKPAFGHSFSYQWSDTDRSCGVSHVSCFCSSLPLNSVSVPRFLFVSQISRFRISTIVSPSFSVSSHLVMKSTAQRRWTVVQTGSWLLFNQMKRPVRSTTRRYGQPAPEGG